MLKNELISVVLKTIDGDFLTFSTVVNFSFKKDKYTPYTELTMTVADTENILDLKSVIYQIDVYINRASVHSGLVDTSDCRREKGVSLITIRSRGFTSLLMNNQMTPGLHAKMSLTKLMTEYYEFPYTIKWEEDSAECNYIFVKEHRSMWDSVVNLGYKLYGTYPYIKGTNKIMLRPEDTLARKTFTESELIKIGTKTNTTGIISHLHMQDVDGNYGVYNLHNQNADELMIVRHKQIAFDRQYLNDPERAMQLTFSLASGGWKSRYITIKGYLPFDLNDRISCGDFINDEKICGVTVTGDRNGIISTYYVYDDDFTAN